MICGGSLNEKQQTFQFADGGSSPTSPHQFRIRKGEFKDFAQLLALYHYKSDKIGGGISYNLVLTFKGIVYGGIVIGGMRHQDNYEAASVELRRMVLSPECPKNTASYFLSKVIWWLKKNTNVSVVYTFADKSAGHEGTCYKAANFEYVKTTPPSRFVLWKGKRYHVRSLTIDRPYSRELREAISVGDAEVGVGLPKKLFKYVIKRNFVPETQSSLFNFEVS